MPGGAKETVKEKGKLLSIPHINGIIPYLSFDVWLISLSILFQGSPML